MIKKVLFYLPALVFLLFSILPPRKMQLLPFKGERGYRFGTYFADEDTTKKCTGTLTDTTDSIIVFEYTLDTVNHNESITPVSGFSIKFDKDAKGNYRNLTKYKYLDIAMRMSETFSFTINFKTLEWFTIEGDANWFTQRYTSADAKVDPRGSYLSLEFKKFEEAFWWPEKIKKEWYLTKLEVPDYKQVMGLDFQNPMGKNKLHVPVKMEIREIAFRKDRNPRIWISLISCFVWLISMTIYMMIKERKKNERLENERLGKEQLEKKSEPTHIEMKRRDEEETDRLHTYLKNNYQNPDLSIEIVNTNTGISTDRISVLLKKKYDNKGFREYLNYLRIEEAKYQLKATDRTIAEIAFAVGYNNITNFNRVFKQSLGMAPGEFRDQGGAVK
ncbi:MAG: helix-turn-helix domain-containing protein [Chitinispirillaceae bacterium]|nr:helix-turn-helix domain-containing protein [Chitinispirillaceae bacterium]